MRIRCACSIQVIVACLLMCCNEISGPLYTVYSRSAVSKKETQGYYLSTICRQLWCLKLRVARVMQYRVPFREVRFAVGAINTWL